MKNRLSIVILTYNNLEYTIKCLYSIRKHSNDSNCEIIVVDNASTDGTVEWLREQSDLKVVYNSINRGFPAGCNQGIARADKENDIFLLNNDTIVMKNSLQNMKKALYSNEKIGAVGAVSNCISNKQQVEESFETLMEWEEYASCNNIYNESRHEDRIRLIGFALMIKRRALDETGLLDELFSPGNYEDDDYCLRLLLKGYRLILCRDSFIFHYGSRSFGKEKEKYMNLNDRNLALFQKKWKGIKLSSYSIALEDTITLLQKEKAEGFSLLEWNCGCGVNLRRIKALFPISDLYGIEQNEILGQAAQSCGTIYTEEAQLEKGRKYRYILLGNSLMQTKEPEALLTAIMEYIEDDGKIFLEVYNLNHYSVLLPLLRGSFMYREFTITDRKNIHFYTKEQLFLMVESNGYNIDSGNLVSTQPGEEERKLLEQLGCIMGVSWEDYTEYKYVLALGVRR